MSYIRDVPWLLGVHIEQRERYMVGWFRDEDTTFVYKAMLLHQPLSHSTNFLVFLLKLLIIF